MIREIKTYEEEEMEAAAKRNRILAFVAVAFLIALAVYCSSCRTAHADEIDMAKIAQIESSGCKFKVGDGGDSNGCHQVSSDALKEYNQFNRTKYTKKDLMNDAISLKVASWYMNKRIPQMLKHFGIEDTTLTRIASYNLGIGKTLNWYRRGANTAHLPEITRRYYVRYVQG